jgi:hypothetical protein
MLIIPNFHPNIIVANQSPQELLPNCGATKVKTLSFLTKKNQKKYFSILLTHFRIIKSLFLPFCLPLFPLNELALKAAANVSGFLF